MIAVRAQAIASYLRDHRLAGLFTEELGWERDSGRFELFIDDEQFKFDRVATKRGFAVLTSTVHRTTLASRGLLRRIQRQIAQRHHEHILICLSNEPRKQVWQWSTRRPDGRKFRHREHPFFSDQPPPSLIERLEQLRFSLDEEENATLTDAVTRVRSALDVTPENDLFARFPSFARQSDTLAVRVQSGDMDAFEEFVLFHQRLARKASKMLVRWVGLEPEDAEQVAMIGVIEAARRFDPSKGYQFSTYASYWIRQQCQRYGVNEGLPIRFPTYVFWPAYKFKYRYAELLATHGEQLTEEMIDNELEEEGLQRE